MASKRLSVIIPGYNNPEHWWRRCIGSVIENIGENDEVICVDDFSARRPDILLQYMSKDPRIRVIYRRENGGLSVARNDGIAASHGEYVTFVDSDDELLPETYSRALDSLKKYNSDIVVFGVRSIWVNEHLFKDNVPEEADLGAMNARTVKRLFDDSLLNYAWNKVYRRSFLEKHKLKFDPDGMPCEDIIFVLRCVMAGAIWSSISHLGIKYLKTHVSLLSKYKRSYMAGTKMATRTWRKYKEMTPGAAGILGTLGEVDDHALLMGEWDNIWRMASPYGVLGRWRFLKQHKEITSGVPALLCFIKRTVYAFLRRYFYIVPVQRWHIKRMYPDVKPLCTLDEI